MIYEGNEWVAYDTAITFKELDTAPAEVEEHHIRVYAKDKDGVSALYLKDDDGNEREIATTEAIVSDHGELEGLADDDHPQYHNDARALTWIGTRSTSDLPEGSNLYYTDERVDDRLAAAGGGSSWSVLTNGDEDAPELIFADGDVIMVEVPA